MNQHEHPPPIGTEPKPDLCGWWNTGKTASAAVEGRSRVPRAIKALLGNPPPIVIDFGTGYTKAGELEEPCPGNRQHPNSVLVRQDSLARLHPR